MTSGTSLSAAASQACVKTLEENPTLQAEVHCPAGSSPTEQSDLSARLQTQPLEVVSKSGSLHGLPYPATWEPAHPAQNPVREAWRGTRSVSLSEATDAERHGLVMSLWEACSAPLDAQKPHLGFL